MTINTIRYRAQSIMVRLAKDEQGGELVETALLLGLIVITALGIMSKVGVNVMNKWTAIRDAF